MKTLQSKGLLLHQIAFSESSKIIKVFCRSSGLISLIAKGASRPKSKFRGRLQSYSILELVYNPSNAEKLLTLQDISLVKPLVSIRSDLQKQATANLWLEIYLRHLFGSESSIPLYELLESSLLNLENSPKVRPHLMTDFLLQFFALMGFRPQFKICLHCGTQDFQSRAYFDLAMGGPTCHNCVHQSPHFKKVFLKQLEWLEQLQIMGSYSHSISTSLVSKTEELLIQFLYHQSSRSGALKSYSFYQNMLRVPLISH